LKNDTWNNKKQSLCYFHNIVIMNIVTFPRKKPGIKRAAISELEPLSHNSFKVTLLYLGLGSLLLSLGTHLFVKVPRPGDREVTF